MFSYMSILFLLLMGAGLGVLLYCAKTQGRNPNANMMAMCAVIVLVFSFAGFIWKGTAGGGSAMSDTAEHAAAWDELTYSYFADEVAKASVGRRVLIFIDKAAECDSVYRKRVDIFKSTLEAAGIQCRESCSTPAALSTGAKNDEMGSPSPEDSNNVPPSVIGAAVRVTLTAKEYNDTIDANPECNLIVFFTALPVDWYDILVFSSYSPSDADAKKVVLSEYADCSYMAMHISSGRITHVMRFKPDPKLYNGNPPKDTKTAFEERYLLITPDNLNEIGSRYQCRVFCQ